MSKNKFRSTLSFFLLYYCSALAQQVQVTPQIKKQISAYIQAEMRAEKIPGLSYAVVSNRKIIDSGAYGLADVELNAPVTSHSLFSIGSIGKTFTATGIMLLQ